MKLDDVAVYVKVVQAGSFTQAAKLLTMPTTTVSARVARLERALGVTLIRRTTRKLHVTQAGSAYFERCVDGLAQIDAASREVASAAAEPQGPLRLTAPADVAHDLLPPIVDAYLDRYPRTEIELIVTNRVVDLIADGIDLAIRAAELKDSSLVARRFRSSSGGLWASPRYLAEHGAPRSPRDLERHRCVVFAPSRRPWRLTDGRRSIQLALTGRLTADDPETMRALLVRGAGIGMLPDFVAAAAAHTGELQRTLPRWSWPAGNLWFVFPRQRFVPLNVRAFIDVALAVDGTLQNAGEEATPSG